MIHGRNVTQKKKEYNHVTHCIFDMDGTILDSEVVYQNIIKGLCVQYGKKYSSELEQRLLGGTDRAICTILVKELKFPISINDLEVRLLDLANQQLPKAPLMRGAERLLTHLHDCNVPMALATNSTEQAVRLQATNRPILFGLFNHKVSVSDPGVKKGKPAPDIFLVAAERFPRKPKPVKCLVFEDSAMGVQAATEAGMQVVLIADRKLQTKEARCATLVIPSFMEFKPELFGLPPFRDLPKPKYNRIAWKDKAKDIIVKTSSEDTKAKTRHDKGDGKINGDKIGDEVINVKPDSGASK